MGESVQETRQATKNLLNIDIQKVHPLRGWSWECLQGTVKNETGELEIINANAEEPDDSDINDPRFEQEKF